MPFQKGNKLGRKFQKGHRQPKEAKEKMRQRMFGNKHALGTKRSEEQKKKMGENSYWKGKRPWNWTGKISFYSADWTDILREAIRQRDNYTCQLCGIHQDELTGWLKKLDIHHIDYNKKNCNPNNLIALCRSCHQKTSSNREYWRTIFSKF